jgi:Cysteine-rich secretory protein family
LNHILAHGSLPSLVLPDGSTHVKTAEVPGSGDDIFPISYMAGQTGTGMSQEILTAHNHYRAEVGTPPLQWSDALAQSAQQWADHLASSHQLAHSGTGGVGENLWMGTARAYSPTQMVASWGDEKAHFIPGIFPKVSSASLNEGLKRVTELLNDSPEPGRLEKRATAQPPFSAGLIRSIL